MIDYVLIAETGHLGAKFSPQEPKQGEQEKPEPTEEQDHNGEL